MADRQVLSSKIYLSFEDVLKICVLNRKKFFLVFFSLFIVIASVGGGRKQVYEQAVIFQPNQKMFSSESPGKEIASSLCYHVREVLLNDLRHSIEACASKSNAYNTYKLLPLAHGGLNDPLSRFAFIARGYDATEIKSAVRSVSRCTSKEFSLHAETLCPRIGDWGDKLDINEVHFEEVNPRLYTVIGAGLILSFVLAVIVSIVMGLSAYTRKISEGTK
ncbi:hypothetical protein [Pseudomonas sp. NPDC007930]|uniref:hypothetical protein n=1 Tax=Pseudomonas sp. NPDC007930 TaxID=3364417 RepID=UPI0036E3E69B